MGSMTKRRLKSILNYISTVVTWTLFIVLLIIGLLLVWYFISIKIIYQKTNIPPKYTIYTIVSQSMHPNIKVYDMVINKRVDNPKSLKVGDVITFKSTCPSSLGLTVTHRIQKVYYVDGKYNYMTKGDKNPLEDEGPAFYENVIGKVVYKLPGLGRIQFFVSSKMGWLMLVIAPALYILIKNVIKLVQVTKMKKDAKKENDNSVQENNINHPIKKAKEEAEIVMFKREELIKITDDFIEKIQSYEIANIPSQMYLDILNEIESKLTKRYFYPDKRFVTYGRIGNLKNEFILKISNQNDINENWDNKLGAILDFQDIIKGDQYITLDDVPNKEDLEKIINENKDYYKEGIMCLEEANFILEMVYQWKEIINKTTELNKV